MLFSTKSWLNSGLFVLRAGIGTVLLFHGWPNLMGGIEEWTRLGQSVKVFQITFAYTFWGFMGAVTETVGGLCLILGLLTRSVLVFLAVTMLVATGTRVAAGDPIANIAQPVEMLVVLCGLFLTGPGRFSLDHLLMDANTDDNSLFKKR